MKLICLGTGSPDPSPTRASSGYLVEVAEASYLFDMGGGSLDNLIRSGRKPWEIRHLFFSHLHSDHMIDLPRYLHLVWDQTSLPVFQNIAGPAPLATLCAAPFREGGFLHHDIAARTLHPGSVEVYRERGGQGPRPGPAFDIDEINAGWSYEDDLVKIGTFSVAHAEPYLRSVGYRVACKTSGKVLVYPGDSALTPELADGCRGADLLIHWCYRAKGDARFSTIMQLAPDAAQVGAFAKQCGVGHLVLTHFRPSMNPAEARAQAEETFAGPVTLAEDLLALKV